MATASTYTLLQRTVTVGTLSSVTFSNIPQSGYTDLKIVVCARGTEAQNYNSFYLTFNGSTTGYVTKAVEGAGGGGATTFTYSANPNLFYGSGVGASATTLTYNNAEIHIPNYNSSNAKSITVEEVGENNNSTAYLDLTVGNWTGTAGITSITFSAGSNNYLGNSTFSLYALSAVGTTPGTPKALGGDVIRSDGSYWYHAFFNSGTFTPQTALSCDYLVIAGGGGGGNGGGGAGGFRTATSQSLTTTSYPVVVGAGGTGVGATIGPGTNSIFNSFSATGGAKGVTTGSGLSGGSGSGGIENNSGGAGNAGGYSPVEGYAGGNGNGGGYAGGGGAGGIGGNTSTSNTGGNGGIGAYSTLTDAMGAATSTGVLSGGHYYYAGGGGGAGVSTGGTGGTGGGGNGASTGGTAGLVNTGSGGGGVYFGTSGNILNGGSGIVIVRYAV